MTFADTALDYLGARSHNSYGNESFGRRGSRSSPSSRNHNLKMVEASPRRQSEDQSDYMAEVIENLHIQIGKTISYMITGPSFDRQSLVLLEISDYFEPPKLDAQLLTWTSISPAGVEIDNQTNIFEVLGDNDFVEAISTHAFRRSKDYGPSERIPAPASPRQSTTNSRSLFDEWLPKKSMKGHEFLPTDQLLTVVKDEFENYTSKLDEQTRLNVIDAFDEQNSATSASVAFAEILKDMFATVALRIFDGIYDDSSITEDKEFTTIFQHAILEAFPIRPSAYLKFAQKLRRELIDFIEHDGELIGRWGKVTMKNGELAFRLNDQIDRGLNIPENWEFSSFEE
jgi:hypothetical protein